MKRKRNLYNKQNRKKREFHENLYHHENFVYRQTAERKNLDKDINLETSLSALFDR